jgi:hypothetical protein
MYEAQPFEERRVLMCLNRLPIPGEVLDGHIYTEREREIETDNIGGVGSIPS